jgi:hypothetical protein
MSNDNTFSIRFYSQQNDNEYIIHANTDVNAMLREVLEQSVYVKEINQQEADEEYLNFQPPFGLPLLELAFHVVDSKGIPLPKDRFISEEALIEIAAMQDGIDIYGNLFNKTYSDAEDAEHCIEIIDTKGLYSLSGDAA